MPAQMFFGHQSNPDAFETTGGLSYPIWESVLTLNAPAVPIEMGGAIATDYYYQEAPWFCGTFRTCEQILAMTKGNIVATMDDGNIFRTALELTVFPFPVWHQPREFIYKFSSKQKEVWKAVLHGPKFNHCDFLVDPVTRAYVKFREKLEWQIVMALVRPEGQSGQSGQLVRLFPDISELHASCTAQLEAYRKEMNNPHAPPVEEPVSPDALRQLLGPVANEDGGARYTAEGGWVMRPSSN